GDYVDRWSRQAAAIAGGWLLAAFACLAAIGIGIAVVLPLSIKDLLPGEEWLGLIGLVPLTGGVLCITLASVRSYRTTAAAFSFTAISFAALLFAVALPPVDRPQTNHILWRAIYARSARAHVATSELLAQTS